MSMEILDDMLMQVAVYWPPVIDDEHGKKTYGTVVEVPCFWILTNRVALMEKGDIQMFMSKVYVQTPLAELGVLWLSTASAVNDPPGTALSQLTDSVNPFNNPGAAEIRKYAKIPTLDGDQSAMIAYL